MYARHRPAHEDGQHNTVVAEFQRIALAISRGLIRHELLEPRHHATDSGLSNAQIHGRAAEGLSDDDIFGPYLRGRDKHPGRSSQAMRQAVGNHFLIGIRLVIDEGSPDGLHFDECVQTALWLKEAGTVDFINAIY